MKIGFSISVLAVMIASAAFATTASASLVGGAVCGTAPAVCAQLGVTDYDGYTTTDGGQPATPGDEDAGSYHCNNVLYVGRPEDTGTRTGTAYYTVGDPSVNASLGGPGTGGNLDPGTHPGEGDCDLDGGGGDNQTLAASCVTGTTTLPCSLVLLRGVGYLDALGGVLQQPGCGARNPCNGSEAGYVGVGRGDVVNVDAGGQGNVLP
jgi:hypothetical protein